MLEDRGASHVLGPQTGSAKTLFGPCGLLRCQWYGGLAGMVGRLIVAEQVVDGLEGLLEV